MGPGGKSYKLQNDESKYEAEPRPQQPQKTCLPSILQSVTALQKAVKYLERNKRLQGLLVRCLPQKAP